MHDSSLQLPGSETADVIALHRNQRLGRLIPLLAYGPYAEYDKQPQRKLNKYYHVSFVTNATMLAFLRKLSETAVMVAKKLCNIKRLVCA